MIPIAEIIVDEKKCVVKDGSDIIDVCISSGINFGCYVGVCKSCKIKVQEGMDNLSDLTDEEKESDLEPDERLACQCKVLHGTVRIKTIVK